MDMWNLIGSSRFYWAFAWKWVCYPPETCLYTLVRTSKSNFLFWSPDSDQTVVSELLERIQCLLCCGGFSNKNNRPCLYHFVTDDPAVKSRCQFLTAEIKLTDPISDWLLDMADISLAPLSTDEACLYSCLITQPILPFHNSGGTLF